MWSLLSLKEQYSSARKCKVVLDRSRTPDPWLILDGVEDLVEGELEQDEVLCRLEVKVHLEGG